MLYYIFTITFNFTGKLDHIHVCSKCKNCWTIIVTKCRNKNNEYVCLKCDPDKLDNLNKSKNDREVSQPLALEVYCTKNPIDEDDSLIPLLDEKILVQLLK